MLEKVKVLKENLKDPKKKALTELAIFGIFFLFIFLVMSVSSHYSNSIVVEEKEEIYYTCIYKIGDTIINYDSKTNSFDNTTDIINLEYYNYENIITVSKENEFIESTTYQDKTTKTTYELKDLDTTKESDITLKVILTKNESNFINNINIENLGFEFNIECQKKDE